MNFLPGNEALKQQRNYRTGSGDGMLQCGKMSDGRIRAPWLVSLPLKGRASMRLRSGSLSPVSTDSRSEEPTSELQSLMRISYAVFCLKKTNITSSNLNTILSYHYSK